MITAHCHFPGPDQSGGPREGGHASPSSAKCSIQIFKRRHQASRARYGGGFESRFNPDSNSGAGSEGGRPNINIKNLGSTQVQPRFNPGSTQVQPGLIQFEPRFNPGSTVQPRFEPRFEPRFQPRFNPGSTQVQSRFNLGSTQVKPSLTRSTKVQSRFEPGSNPGSTQVRTQVQTQVQPRFEPRFEPRFNPGSTQVLITLPSATTFFC